MMLKNVDVRLTIIKPFHVRWIGDNVKSEKNFFSGFRKAQITGTVSVASNFVILCENLLQELEMIFDKN